MCSFNLALYYTLLLQLLGDHYGRHLYHRLTFMNDRQLKVQMTPMKGDTILMVQSKA